MTLVTEFRYTTAGSIPWSDEVNKPGWAESQDSTSTMHTIQSQTRALHPVHL